MPKGVVIFAGGGIQDNLADKARVLGVPARQRRLGATDRPLHADAPQRSHNGVSSLWSPEALVSQRSVPETGHSVQKNSLRKDHLRRARRATYDLPRTEYLYAVFNEGLSSGEEEQTMCEGSYLTRM